MRFLKNFIVPLLPTLFLLQPPVYSQDIMVIPPEKPKIIVGIVVSQMRYDYIQRYWDKLDENGIKLLMNRGTSFKNAGFNYISSEKGVGHASLATGTTPSDHGIVGLDWYLQLQDKIENNTEDLQHKAVGGDADNGHYGPKNLMCTTFSDELRISNNFKSKTYSVSMDPAPGIFSVGQTGEGVRRGKGGLAWGPGYAPVAGAALRLPPLRQGPTPPLASGGWGFLIVANGEG
jgi:hypothetical protein